jgi:hypothetical protein
VSGLRILALLAAVGVLSACGGGGGGASGGGGGANLTADVSKAEAEVVGDKVVASARVRVGGVPGRKLVFEWGLVDAEQGRESQEERVVARYVTTRKVVTHDETIRVPRPDVSTPYLIHFVLYAPDGTYLDSEDTHDFGG